MYSLIRSHIEIPDKEGYESLFEAEINRFSELMIDIERNEKLKLNSFIAVDEIFNSTNYIEGVSASYSVCGEISKKKKLNSIVTTHYNYLTNLQKSTKGKFKNYRVVINKKGEDIEFKYKIKKGISNDFIALDLLNKREFNKEIIKNAKKTKTKLDNYLKL
jgi:DNA mismatch repair ATPase MutS